MFVETLHGVAERIDGVRCLMLVGRDGMVVASTGGADRDEAESLAATYVDLLRRIDKGHEECGLRGLREWISGLDDAWVVLRAVTPQYLLLAWTSPDALLGRLRFELRKAASTLEPELRD